MPDKPSLLPRLGASDGTITSPGKITEPLETKKDRGQRIGDKPLAQHLNWYLNLIYRWLFVLDWFLDRFGYNTLSPSFQFRENWLNHFSITADGPAWSGSPWYVRVTGTGAEVKARPRNSTNHFPGATVKPGTDASGRVAWIYTADAGGLGQTCGLFWADSTIVRVALEWTANVSGQTTTDWYMGFTAHDEVNGAFGGGTPTTETNDFWGFRAAAGDTNWKCVTHKATGPAETVTDSGIAVGTSTWRRFRIDFDGTGTPTVRFYINGTLVATHTTNLEKVMAYRIGFGGRRTGAASVQMELGPLAAPLNVFA